MNIKDSKEKIQDPKKTMLEEIFEAQTALMDKYHPIEKANGLMVPENLVDIDSITGQFRIKDFMWRVTEELTEASQAFDDFSDTQHFHEEMADVFHFFVELLIMVGWTHKTPLGYMMVESLDSLVELFMQASDHIQESVPPYPQNPELFWRITTNLGLAANCLKQKPWKQTHVFTDKTKFNGYLFYALLNYIILCQYNGITAKNLYQTYFKKNEVNHFRIGSNY